MYTYPIIEKTIKGITNFTTAFLREYFDLPSTYRLSAKAPVSIKKTGTAALVRLSNKDNNKKYVLFDRNRSYLVRA